MPRHQLSDGELKEIDRLLTAIADRELMDDLNDWERQFFKEMLEKREQYGKRMFVSDKQYAKLEDMANPQERQKDRWRQTDYV